VQRPLTSEGMIIGTFQYMSPEQLEGQHIDHRSDIFALGAVLYEMATGRRAFDGKTKTSLIAAIVAAQPKPVHELQPLTPAAFEHVIAKCLEKDPEDRWQTAHDIASELEWIMEGLGREAAQPRTATRAWKFAALALALALLGALTAVVLFRRSRSDARLSVALALPARLVDFYNQAALSPDGSSVVMVGYKNHAQSLWLRKLDTDEPQPLAATDGATQPFWSPDGKWITFFADGKLKRIPSAGGPPQTICANDDPDGGTWSGNTIVFAMGSTGPLYRVDANGGQPVPVTKVLPNEEAHRWPSFLPDGDHVLFLVDASVTEGHHIRVVSLKDGSIREVMQGVTNAIYAEPGYLLFTRGGSLIAQPFDAKKLTLSGDPRVLAEHVPLTVDTHRREFTASADGRLIYRSANDMSQMTWVDRNGKALETFGEAHRFRLLQLSNDQKRVVVEQTDADGRGDDLWLFDVGRNAMTRFTFDPASDVGPVWSPDGTRVAFASMRGAGDVYVADASNPTRVTRLTNVGSTDVFPTSWSPDGTTLFMDRTTGKTNNTTIHAYSFQTHQLTPFIATSASNSTGMISPDGSRFAYVSNESGHPEVYVALYPSLTNRRQVSNGGGGSPHWRRDGRELFYISSAAEVVSFDVTKDDALPQPLFRYFGNDFVVSGDGQRILTEQPIDDVTRVPLTLVTNWAAAK
jgi:Tol biopolymer transport system component